MAEEHLEEDVFRGKIDFSLWRRLLMFLRPYKANVIGVVSLALLVAGCDIMLPILTGGIINALQREGREVNLWPYALPYAITFAVLAVCVFLFIRVVGSITVGVGADIRAALFDKLQQLPFAYYDKRAVGWLMARLTGDCSSLSRVMSWGLLDITWGSFTLLGTAVIATIYSWRLAVVVLAIVPLLVLSAWWFQVRLLRTSRKIRKANSIVTGAYNEGLAGVRTSKSMVREDRNAEEFAVLTTTLYGHSIRNAMYAAVFLPAVLSICSIGIALALWRGGGLVSVGAISLGTLSTFLLYATNISNPAQELAMTLAQIQGAQASAERIVGLLDEPLSIADSDAVLAKLKHAYGDPTLAADGHRQRIDTIEFKNVSFSYKAGQPVLSDFDFTVHAGQTVALVGPTGGGKSTIVSLLCRFYEPTGGEILIDGVDYRQRGLNWYQSQLGMVLQQPHLFSGTVRDNIRYGRLDATDEEVIAAAQATRASEFIERLDKQYDAPVGEGGNQLSTGQKQLITLARAVLADPQIFVMDEATSSVDTQTERDIQSAVEKVLKGRISFVIAHRLSTIRNADTILVIDGGRVIEAGSHGELLTRRGRYHALYTNQYAVEREEKLLHA